MAYTPPIRGAIGAITPSTPTPPKPTSYELQDRLKNDRIARSVALNCASQMVEAYSRILSVTDMAKTLKPEEIKGWLKSLKQTENSENLEWLTGEKDTEIPF